MKRQYIIRAKGYFECPYSPENCSVGIHSIYKERADAEKAKLNLERERFIGCGVAFDHIYEDISIQKELSGFLKEKYDLSIWDDEEAGSVKAPIFIPKSISLPDVAKIIDIVKSSFFEIVEKCEKALFYQVEVYDSAWKGEISEELFAKMKIFPKSNFLNEYNKGIKWFNTSQEAYEYGVYKLISNLKNKSSYLSMISIQPDKGSFFMKLLKLATKLRIDDKRYKVIFESEGQRDDLYSLINDHAIVVVTEVEMWDLLYDRIDEFEEEIKAYWEMGTVDLNQLSIEYGIPSFFIETMLNEVLDE